MSSFGGRPAIGGFLLWSKPGIPLMFLWPFKEEAKKRVLMVILCLIQGSQLQLLPSVWLHLTLGEGTCICCPDIQQKEPSGSRIHYRRGRQHPPLLSPHVQLSFLLSAQLRSVDGSIDAALAIASHWEFWWGGCLPACMPASSLVNTHLFKVLQDTAGNDFLWLFWLLKKATPASSSSNTQGVITSIFRKENSQMENFCYKTCFGHFYSWNDKRLETPLSEIMLFLRTYSLRGKLL